MTPRPEMSASLMGPRIAGFFSGNCDLLPAGPRNIHEGDRDKILILDAGHFALDDSCDEIATLVRRFLRKHQIE